MPGRSSFSGTVAAPMPPRPERRPGRPAKRVTKRAQPRAGQKPPPKRRRRDDELDDRDGRSTRPVRGRKPFPKRDERPAKKPEGRAGGWGSVARRGASSGGSAAP